MCVCVSVCVTSNNYYARVRCIGVRVCCVTCCDMVCCVVVYNDKV